MMTSQRWHLNSGKLGVVRKDHHRKIGSMQQNNCDRAHIPT
ncbi:MAG: hypothetical protein JWO19_138, partial [Bryobacterales bacterium]|nr:hypothetical protein [Bryobacterales bacterium]